MGKTAWLLQRRNLALLIMPVYELPEFFMQTPRQTCLVGLDYGQKRLGLAVSDTDWRLAQPLAVIERKSWAFVQQELRQNLAGRVLGGFVLGLPLHMSGKAGNMAQATRDFGRLLLSVCAQHGWPERLTFIDERLTSFAAEQSLAEAGISKSKQKARLDAVAAAHILQKALDSVPH